MAYRTYNDPKYVIVYTESNIITSSKGDDKINFDKFIPFQINGINVTKNYAYFGNTEDNKVNQATVDELADGYGEWTVGSKRETESTIECLFFGDRYGYAPIFYSIVLGKSVIISDSFYGVISGLSASGVVRTLNYPHYVTTMASSSPLFQNMYSNETMSNEVNILSQDKALLISNDQISFIDRDLLGDVTKHSTHAASVSAGIEHAISCLGVTNQLTEIERRLTLSGGIDSRLCAAVLKRAGGLNDTGVSSVDPRVWGQRSGIETVTKDIVLSDIIRRDNALEWWHPGGRDRISLSFIESLMSYQSYRSNFAFTFKANQSNGIFRNDLMTFRGGGGEMLRGTSGADKMNQEFIDENNRADFGGQQEAQWYANRVLKWTPLEGEIKDHAVSSISQVYPKDRGTCFEERVNILYFNHRNRGHFGHARITSSTNDLTLHPLSNPHFLRASSLLDFDQLKNGTLIREIFAQSDPDLLKYPFDNEKSNRLLGRSEYRNVDFNDTAWINSYDYRKRKSPGKFLPSLAPGDRGENFNFDATQSGINYLRRGFAILEDLVPPDTKRVLSKFHQELLVRVQASRLNNNHTVAKLASAMDAFFPQAASGGFLKVDCHPLRPVINIRVPDSVANIPSVPQDGLNNVPVEDFVFGCHPGQDYIEATVEPRGSLKLKYEYAFYLYKNNKRVDVQWYKPYGSAKFTINDKIEKYYVKAFVRKIEEHTPYMIVDINPKITI